MPKDNIQVAVRVRPFVDDEKGQENIVKMDCSKGKVTLTNPGDKSGKDHFYDFCFWSHDDKQGRKMFTNSDLYDKIGIEVLNNSYKGYNSTVFTFGQTGSGKSYSIEGTKEDKGLLQRICESLLNKKEEVEKTEGNSLNIYASYLDIYNENLRDLVDSTDKELKAYHLKESIFVKNLSKTFCDDYGDISKLIEDGKKMRIVGATSMNKQSSRSHAIFILYITLKEKNSKTNNFCVNTSEIYILLNVPFPSKHIFILYKSALIKYFKKDYFIFCLVKL